AQHPARARLEQGSLQVVDDARRLGLLLRHRHGRHSFLSRWAIDGGDPGVGPCSGVAIGLQWEMPPSPMSKGRAMRAQYPDQDGYVERDGVKVFYEVFGEGDPTVLLMPTWSI